MLSKGSAPLIFGGGERRFAATEYSFFLEHTEALRDPERCFSLTPEDCARVNPNTGTAPVFRTRRGRRGHAAHLRTASGAGGQVRGWGA